MTTRFEAEQADTQRQRKGAKSFKDGVNQNVTNSKGNSHLVQKPGLPQSGLDGATVQQPSAVSTRHTFNKSHAPMWWQRLSLRTKATAIAIALSTIPIVALGATAYYLTNKNITQSITQQHQARVISLANQLDRFILDHYRDIQTLSQLSILNNPSVRAVTSATEKQAVLNQFIKNNPAYDSIVVTDLSGNVILQSAGEVITNYSEIDYFQEVRRTNRPVITTPRKSKATGEYSIFFAAPVVDTATGRTIAIVRSRTPVRYFNEILQTEAKELAQNIPGFGSEEYFALNNVGTIVVAPTAHLEYIGKNAQAVFPTAARLQATDAVGSVVDIDRLEQEEYLISYSPVAEIEGLPNLNWSVMVAQPAAEVFAARRGLLLLFTIATLVTLLLVAAIAAYLAKRATRPILAATKAVEKLGQGELDTRIAVAGEDELAVLGSNINRMADQLQIQLQKQEADAERSQQFADITLLVRRSLNMQDILNTAVKEVRKVLKTDRVVIYRFDPEWNGTVIAESVGSDWTPALGAEIEDTCFRQDHGELYKKGRIRAIDNIYQAGLTDCHIRLLERFEVKANLIAPIQTDNQLLGLLITHQCSFSRAWQQSEIDLFTHLAIQIGFALDQASLLEQVEKARQQAEVVSREQRQQKESLQRQLMELLTDIEGASSGDLTVRAEVTAGEIGTVADFFNAIIESLRQIVTSVKKAAGQVNVSVGQNESAIQRLADEALNQAEEITRTLDSVEQMTLSIQAVADNARLAAEVARTASTSAEAGGAAMDLTVQSILNLRDTVAQTATKVKRLGESSQQISKVVFLINQIALQTNVLAINASIEAARAGEEGRGFAVVAEEVGQLAAKSSQATKEIEQILENIQLETTEVVRAMELGTTQVIEGTHLVEDTKKSLGQILNVSRQIDQLVQSISSATVTQAQTSVAVTDLMKEIAKVSERTANASRQVSGSLQQTVEVAQQLQASVGEFKVGAQS